MQAVLVKACLDGHLSRLRKYKATDILNAIAYVVRSGCQWSMLPSGFPGWKTVYHHFRSLSERGWFISFLSTLVEAKRASMGQAPEPQTDVMDSQSVRSALPHSEKGVDGNKKIKGIKRHVTVDSNGYVIGVSVTTANVHDSKGAIPLIAQLVVNHRDIHLLKTDLGYVSLGTALSNIESPVLECIKSNFGTPHFIPINGRWVVERTFSWMENYRRLTRNYERLLKVARHIFIVGCVFFMLRYFA